MAKSFLCSINGSIMCLYEVVTTELLVNDGERDERVLREAFVIFSASSAAAIKSSSDASAK